MHDEPQPDRLRFFHRLRRNFTMIVVLKHNPNPEQLQSLITWLQEKGIIIPHQHRRGQYAPRLLGDTEDRRPIIFSALDIVEDVKRDAGRMTPTASSIPRIPSSRSAPADRRRQPHAHGRPCSVESEEQVVAIAKGGQAAARRCCAAAFKALHLTLFLRGLGEVGLRYLPRIAERRRRGCPSSPG